MKQSKQSLSDTDFDLTKTYGQTQGKTSSLVDFNLTKTQKSRIPSGKTLKKADLENISASVNAEKVSDVYGALA